MDSVLVTQLISAVSTGDAPKFFTYVAIFFLIWREVKGLKKEVKEINNLVGIALKKGEDRFKDIENVAGEHNNRITRIEQHLIL